MKNIKVTCVGDSGIGKTQILHKLCYNENVTNCPTIGMEYLHKIIKEKNIKIEFWDTSGKNVFRKVVHSFYDKCDIIIIFFDYNSNYMPSINSWINDIKDNSNLEKKILLVGLTNYNNDIDNNLKKYSVINKIDICIIDRKNINDLLDEIDNIFDEKKNKVQLLID